MSQSKKILHKNLLLGTLFFLLGIDLSGQTFGVGFDNPDFCCSSRNGQELSFYANVKSDVHNIETTYLKGYINIYQAPNSWSGNSNDKGEYNSGGKITNLALSPFGGVTYIGDKFINFKNFSTQFGFEFRALFSSNLCLGAGISIEALKSYSEISLSYNSVVLNRTIQNQYKFISIPIILNYHFMPNSNWRPFLGLKIIGSVLTCNKQTSEDELFYSESEFYNNGDFTSFISAQMGIEYQFHQRIRIQFGIDYRLALTPLKWEYLGQSGNVIVNKSYFRYSSLVFGINYLLKSQKHEK